MPPNFELNWEPDSRVDARSISLPTALRWELGLLVGQTLKIGPLGQEILLQVSEPLSPQQETTLIPVEVYNRLGSQAPCETLEITLGCDPEFFILWKKRVISASTYLPFSGQIGCDGSLGELRPHYGQHEKEVVRNLSKLICKIPSTLKRCSWATGLPETGHQFSYEGHSYYANVSAGFHVHLGLPAEILNTRIDFNRMALNHLVQCLDWYVSVPLILWEENHARRLGHSQYGRPGDYRLKNTTLEYRTPGGYLLRSPQTTGSLLGAALAISEVVSGRMKEASNNFLNLHRLTKEDCNLILPVPPKEIIFNTMLNPNTAAIQKQLPTIHQGLQELPNYSKHQEAIEGLFSEDKDRVWQKPSLFSHWRIGSLSTATQEITC